MAPEAFEGNTTPASDVYSLAATLFVFMTAQPPFSGNSQTEIRENIRLGLVVPAEHSHSIPEDLEHLIRRSLDVRPDRRPALQAFLAELRGSLNRLLADTLSYTSDGSTQVDIQLIVQRQDEDNIYRPIARTKGSRRQAMRDMKKLPAQPDKVALNTGDHIRVSVSADQDGFITVFNVGPLGSLNMLFPDEDTDQSILEAKTQLHIVDVEITPPIGRERLIAIWSRKQLSKGADVLTVLAPSLRSTSESYRATRNIQLVRSKVDSLSKTDWAAVVLELEHTAPPPD